MLGDIVRQLLAGHPDLEVAAEVEEHDAVLSEVRRTRADVVVAGVAAGERRTLPDGLPHALLCEHPGLRLIALADDCRVAYVYELRLQQTAITEISPRALLEVIRNVGPA